MLNPNRPRNIYWKGLFRKFRFTYDRRDCGSNRYRKNSCKDLGQTMTWAFLNKTSHRYDLWRVALHIIVNYRSDIVTFSNKNECSLPRTVSKNTIKKIGHHPRKRDMMGQSCPIYACITRVIHRSTLHFAVAGSTVYRSNTWEKTWQGESLEHMEQYHIKFVEISHHWKRGGRKVFVESLFSWS